MAGKPTLRKSHILEALIDSDGHIGIVAARLRVSRATIYRYLKRYPDLQIALDDERKRGRNEIVEIAQSKLKSGILNNNERMIMFALRHYDKDEVGDKFDVEKLFSSDVVNIMNDNGWNVSTVVHEFEMMIRQYAKEKQNV